MDQIIQNKIGFGKAQWLPFIFLFIVDMNDGAQLVLSSFLTPVVRHTWQLTSTQASTLTSLFYLGTFIGSIISGNLSDRKGRRFLLKIGSSMQLLSTFLFVFANGYQSLNIIRFLYGISFGFTIVLTTSMFAQTSTIKYRGKGLLLINFAVSFGKLYGILLAYFCLDSFHNGNWKMMMILSAFPNFIVIYGTFFVLRESPRFLAANKRFQQCYENLQTMMKINNPQKAQQQLKLTIEQRQGIVLWQKETFQQHSNQNVNQQNQKLKSIFSSYYLKTTVLLCLGWMSINFMYFGQLIVLPFIYGKQQKSFGSYALTIAGEAPSFLISIFLIDRQGCGRKTSLFYFYTLSAIFHLLFVFSPLTLIASVTRLFMKECFQMLYPFTTQSYGTLTRTNGFGFCAAMGRIASTLMPYIILPLVDINTNYIFIFFTMSALVGSVATYLAPRQPMNRPLDQKMPGSSGSLHQTFNLQSQQ